LLKGWAANTANAANAVNAVNAANAANAANGWDVWFLINIWGYIHISSFSLQLTNVPI
jgi:hypothetical protein